MSYAVHPDVCMGYTFPTPHHDMPSTLPREVQLSRNLRLVGEPSAKKPTYSSQPIKPNAHRVVDSDAPLLELLTTSRAIIDNYTLTTAVPSDTPIAPKEAQRKLVRPLVDDSDEFYSINNTPIPNKTVYFSPGPNKPSQQLTPVRGAKEAVLKKQVSFSNLLKSKRSMKFNPKEPSLVDESINYDDLACHASGILKMAVDSTMLEASFSMNDSSMFPPGAEDDRSLLEGIKSRRQKHIEITTADITAAVQG
ncbi:hypothetical protein DICA4_F09780 [Diutina catenulata]